MNLGIPRALFFYKYQYLLITFFKELKVNIILSEPTNEKTITDGINNFEDTCLAINIYMGHIKNLINKCDYILIPRISCLDKVEKVCPYFPNLYDIIRHTYKSKFIYYNIDIKKKETELYAFIKLGKSLGFSYKKTLRAYHNAKRIEQHKKLLKLKLQEDKLNTNKTKILLAAPSYILYDNLFNIINYLKKANITVILSDIYDSKNKEKDLKSFIPNGIISYNRKLLASISHYKNKVDGIILITPNFCSNLSLTNNLCLLKVKNVPITNIKIDEYTREETLKPQLINFIYTIDNERKNKNAKEKINKLSVSK